jgi:pimeloyl-ACP methyl ester carboxylesterase
MTRAANAELRRFSAAIVVALTIAVVDVSVAHATFSGTLTGTLPSGATYLIEVPPNWNGTLVLYSHRSRLFNPNPAIDAPACGTDLIETSSDPVTHDWLLSHGYALTGSSYATINWAVQDAFQDQIDVLDLFGTQVAPPGRTIAWGQSMGGLITAGLVQLHPERFAGALPMCGLLAGGVATFDVSLDAAFALKTLIDPSLDLVNIGQGLTDLGTAQATPQGRARIALSQALMGVPGWWDPTTLQPDRHDYAAQEVAQYHYAANDWFVFATLRADLASRAGGNPSSNTGVDYRRQLRQSVDSREVKALYEAAGLSLDQDLATLAAAPRISADPAARDYLDHYITLDGRLGGVPVLTMHTLGDGVVVVQSERAYRDAVTAAGDRNLLRQVYVHRAGHCSFTSAEMIAAFQALVHRIDTGTWGDLKPGTLNQEAAALGVGSCGLPTSSEFVKAKPSRFPRSFPGSASASGAFLDGAPGV